MKRKHTVLKPSRFLSLILVFSSIFILNSNRPQLQEYVDDNDPGAIPATFSASVSAKYEVPIVVPPGVNGLQPKVSIVYDSEADNGLLGVGFRLTGFSEIRRIGRDKKHDGVNRGVTYTTADRFSLDGQRLLLDPESGKGYGTEGATYYLRQGGRGVITSHGNSPLGPDYFTIQTKEGLTMKYSYTVSDQHLRSQPKGPNLIWLLETVTDPHGNTIRYNYQSGQYDNTFPKGSNYYYPTSIGYGFTTISFTYEDRNDTTLTFGEKYTSLVKRLKNIDIYAYGGYNPDPGIRNDRKQYEFAYSYSTFTGRSLLDTLYEKDPAGRGKIRKTVFTYPKTREFQWKLASYEPPTPFRFAHIYTPGDRMTHNMPLTGQVEDLNGNGLPDFIQYITNDYGKAVTLTSRNPYLPPKNIPVLVLSPPKAWTNSGAGWTENNSYTPPVPLAPQVEPDSFKTLDTGAELIDINGDGLKDLVRATFDITKGIYDNATYLNTGTGWERDKQWDLPQGIFLKSFVTPNPGPKYNLSYGAMLVDLNDDGILDIIQNLPDLDPNPKAYVFQKGQGYVVSPGYAPPSDFLTGTMITKEKNKTVTQDLSIDLRDLNGDGLPDLIKAIKLDLLKDGELLQRVLPYSAIMLNTGSAWKASDTYQFPAISWLKHTVWDPNAKDEPITNLHDGARWVDLNGDGLIDLIHNRRTSTHKGGKVDIDKAWINTGSGFRLDESYFINGPAGDKSDNFWLSHYEYSPTGGFVYNVDDGARLVDINGDGLVDLVASFRQKYSLGPSQGTQLNTGKGWLGSWHINYAYDIPHDEAPPFANDPPNYPPTWISTILKNPILESPDAIQDGAQFHDLNGDGLLDLIHYVGSYSYAEVTSPHQVPPRIWINTGGAWKYVPNNLPYQPSAKSSIGLLDLQKNYKGELGMVDRGKRMIDVDGDGDLDVVQALKVQDSDKFFQHLMLGQHPVGVDRIMKITDSGEKKIDISYSTLTDPEVYTKGAGLEMGKYNLQYPKVVVKSYRISKNLASRRILPTSQGDFERAQFTYKGLRAERNEGVLGFEEITKIDLKRNHRWTTTFYQDPRRKGLLKAEIWSSNDPEPVVWKKTEYSYNFSRYLIPMLQTKGVYQYKLDGTQSLLQSEAYIHDEYGNLTYIYEQSMVLREPAGSGASKVFPAKTTYFTYTQPTPTHPYGQLRDQLVSEETTPAFLEKIKQAQDGTGLGNIHSWTRYEYTSGNLTAKKEWDDQQFAWISTTYSYDRNGNLQFEYSPVGGTTLYTYGKHHVFLRSVSVNNMPTVNYRYEPMYGNVVFKQESYREQLFYRYDQFGRPLGVRINSDPKIELSPWLETYSYSLAQDISNDYTYGNMTIRHKMRTSWKEDKWMSEVEIVDPFGRKIGEVGMDNGVETYYKRYSYTGNGQLSNETDYNRIGGQQIRSTSFIYNKRGEVKRTRIATGDHLSSITNPLYSDVQEIEGESGYRTIEKSLKDSKENLLQKELTVINYAGKVVKRIRIDEGSMNQANPTTYVTTYEYDIMGRPTKVTDPSSRINTITYNSRGQQISLNNEDTGEKNFTYGPDGMLKTVTDAKGNSIHYTYDKWGRMETKEVPANRQTIRYTYDQTFNKYNTNEGKLTGITVEDNRDGTPGPKTYTALYAYDNQGLLSQSEVWSKQDGQTYVEKFAYNPQGLLTEHIFPDGATAKTSYNGMGNITKLELKEHDDSDFKTYVTYSSYTADGIARNVAYANGLTSTLKYDTSKDLPNNYKLTDGEGNNIVDKTYLWNQRMELVTVVDNRLPLSSGDNESQFFRYLNGRLYSAESKKYGHITYTFGAGGELEKKEWKNGKSIEYKNFVGHRPTTMLTNEGGQQSSYTLKFDHNGNLNEQETASGQNDFYFDAENRLAKMSSSDKEGSIQFTYDGNGRLFMKSSIPHPEAQGEDISHKVFASSQFELNKKGSELTSYTKFLDDAKGHVVAISHQGKHFEPLPSELGSDAPIFGFPAFRGPSPWWVSFLTRFMIFLMLLGGVLWMLYLLLKKDSFPQSRASWTRYLSPPLLSAFLILVFFGNPGGQLMAQEQTPEKNAVAVEKPAQIRYLHHDYINSINLVTGGSVGEQGKVIQRVIFQPFGEKHVITGQLDQLEEEFTGQEEIRGTDLYYYGARFYDPALSIFISADTKLGADAFEQDAFNRYAYATGNPIRFDDPSGHEIVSLLTAVIIGAIIGAVTSAVTDIISQGIRNNWDWSKFNVGQFFVSVGIGLIVGGLTAGTSSAVSSFATNALVHVGLSATRSTVTTIGINSLSGVVFGVAGQVISNAMVIGAQYAFPGMYTNTDGIKEEIDWGQSISVAAVMGGIFGSVGGIKNAKGVRAKNRSLARSSRSSSRSRSSRSGHVSSRSGRHVSHSASRGSSSGFSFSRMAKGIGKGFSEINPSQAAWEGLGEFALSSINTGFSYNFILNFNADGPSRVPTQYFP